MMICEYSDLPETMCAHCHPGPRPRTKETTVTNTITNHAIPWAINFDATGYSRTWTGYRDTVNDNAEPIIVNCTHPTNDRYLCHDCTRELARCLDDIPTLLYDLEVHTVRDTHFVEHGTTNTIGDEDQDNTKAEDGDTSPLPFDQAASQARARLQRALRTAVNEKITTADTPASIARDIRHNLGRLARHPAMPSLARTITAATARAHRIIDAPASPWYYGPCPACHTDIWQEKIHPADTTARVRCPDANCTYSVPVEEHHLAQLDANEDKLMTVPELVSAITNAGEFVTRHQINGWIRRDKLTVKKLTRFKFANGEHTSFEVDACRLGDVRTLALDAQVKIDRPQR